MRFETQLLPAESSHFQQLLCLQYLFDHPRQPNGVKPLLRNFEDPVTACGVTPPPAVTSVLPLYCRDLFVQFSDFLEFLFSKFLWSCTHQISLSIHHSQKLPLPFSHLFDDLAELLALFLLSRTHPPSRRADHQELTLTLHTEDLEKPATLFAPCVRHNVSDVDL